MSPGRSRKRSDRPRNAVRRRHDVTYLVSGDHDIRPCDVILRKSGRRVRHDREVDRTASREIRPGKKYVVVAHGNADGTIMWCRSEEGVSAKWLWVGMSSPPRGARLYLYSCRVGRVLPRYLKQCECFGHLDVVPMPVATKNDVVLAYLDQVDQLMNQPAFGVEDWRQRLTAYVNREYVNAILKSAPLASVLPLIQLRRSLGYRDD
jgi:hypothetical protein